MLEDVAAAYLILAPLAATAAVLGVGLWMIARRAPVAHALPRFRRARGRRRGLD